MDSVGMLSRISPRSITSIFIALSLGHGSLISAEVEVTPKKKDAATEVKVFSIDSVIEAKVAALGNPKMRPGSVGIQMNVSSPSKKAREHVMQGFALVHAQWDFEAYRHFCAAIQEDKECLLAYCGVTLALAQPYNEYSAYRRAAVERMLDLMEADTAAMKTGKPERYPKIEKQFSAATATMISESPVAAGGLFIALGEKFPKLLQARLLGILLTRGSYDVSGAASPAQQKAIENTKKILNEYPENPLVQSFWVSLCAEAPNDTVNFKKELLPVARKLVQKSPDMPTWWHAIGQLEWRAGNYLLAERAFAKSAALYEAWMKESGITINDCPGFVKAKCYLANTLFHRGDFTGAIKVAKEVRALKTDIKRPRSAGNYILLWRGHSLPARLYIAHGAAGDMNRGQKSLPTPAELKPFIEHPKYPSLVGSYINALRVYMGARKAVDDKAFTAAKSLHQVTYRKFVVALVKVMEGAERAGDANHYFNAGRCLAIYDKELAGIIRMHATLTERVAAVGSYYSARDLQYVPTLMMPPLVITPMENRLGDYYLRMGKNDDAYDSYTQGHKNFPNNMGSLIGMKRSLTYLDKKADAAMIQKHIDLVKPKK